MSSGFDEWLFAVHYVHQCAEYKGVWCVCDEEGQKTETRDGPDWRREEPNNKEEIKIGMILFSAYTGTRKKMIHIKRNLDKRVGQEGWFEKPEGQRGKKRKIWALLLLLLMILLLL